MCSPSSGGLGGWMGVCVGGCLGAVGGYWGSCCCSLSWMMMSWLSGGWSSHWWMGGSEAVGVGGRVLNEWTVCGWVTEVVYVWVGGEWGGVVGLYWWWLGMCSPSSGGLGGWMGVCVGGCLGAVGGYWGSCCCSLSWMMMSWLSGGWSSHWWMGGSEAVGVGGRVLNEWTVCGWVTEVVYVWVGGWVGGEWGGDRVCCRMGGRKDDWVSGVKKRVSRRMIGWGSDWVCC